MAQPLSDMDELYLPEGESHSPEELYPLALNHAPALMTNVILDRIFSMLRIHQLKKCRLVCKKWNELACPLLSNKTEKILGAVPFLRSFRAAPYLRDYTDPLKDASDFVDFMEKRDPSIGMTFSNIRITPSYLPDLTGDLLLHPQIRNGIKCLYIEVYPPQVEWLKTCIQGMKNLRELNVELFLTTPLRDCSKILHPPPPPLSNIPKKLLDIEGKLPPSLKIPDEYLASVQASDIRKDLVLEKLSVAGGLCLHRVQVPDEAQDFWMNCLQGDDRSLRNWILQRAPSLKYIHCQYRCQQNFVETLGRISREYKGKGLKGFRIERSSCYDKPRPWMNEDWDKIFQEFLQTYCLNTLEILDITYCLEKDGRIFFRFPDLPFACLRTLVITPPTSTQYYKDADFKWVPYYYKERRGKHRPGDLEGYFLTEKIGQEELTDIFNIFHQNHSLNVLENLEFTIEIQLQYRRRSRWFRNIKRHNLKLPILYARTTRSFPRVKKLIIKVNFAVKARHVNWPHSEKFKLEVDYISLLENAFPALTQFRIAFLDLELMNPLLQKLPAKIEILQIYCPTSLRPLSDRMLLGNKALLRLSELRELAFYSCMSCSFTDKIIYNGFLKLPHLQVLRFSDVYHRTDPCTTTISFSSEGLLALARKLDVLEYCKDEVLQNWPVKSASKSTH